MKITLSTTIGELIPEGEFCCSHVREFDSQCPMEDFNIGICRLLKVNLLLKQVPGYTFRMFTKASGCPKPPVGEIVDPGGAQETKTTIWNGLIRINDRLKIEPATPEPEVKGIRLTDEVGLTTKMVNFAKSAGNNIAMQNGGALLLLCVAGANIPERIGDYGYRTSWLYRLC